MPDERDELSVDEKMDRIEQQIEQLRDATLDPVERLKTRQQLAREGAKQLILQGDRKGAASLLAEHGLYNEALAIAMQPVRL